MQSIYPNISKEMLLNRDKEDCRQRLSVLRLGFPCLCLKNKGLIDEDDIDIEKPNYIFMKGKNGKVSHAGRFYPTRRPKSSLASMIDIHAPPFHLHGDLPLNRR
jgi:hypothetical protein